MRIINVEQRSPEWFAARAGIISASDFDKIVTTTGARSKQREKYLYKLAGEKVAGKPEDSFQSAAMARGVELEAEARSLYQFITGQEVQQVGFCIVDGPHEFGCSPDGFVGQDGLIEIKCPSIHTHVEYLLNDELPSDYFQQVQGQMLVTGRKWNDFVSHYPGLKPLIKRAHPDVVFLKKLESELIEFCKDLKSIVEKIK